MVESKIVHKSLTCSNNLFSYSYLSDEIFLTL